MIDVACPWCGTTVDGGYLEYLEHAYDHHPQQAGERHGPDPRDGANG